MSAHKPQQIKYFKVVVSISDIRKIRLEISQNSTIEDVSKCIAQRASDLCLDNYTIYDETSQPLTNLHFSPNSQPPRELLLKPKPNNPQTIATTDMDDINLLTSPDTKSPRIHTKPTPPSSDHSTKKKPQEFKNATTQPNTRNPESQPIGTNPWILHFSRNGTICAMLYQLCLFVPVICVVLIYDQHCDQPLFEWNCGVLVVCFVYVVFQVIFLLRRVEFVAESVFALRVSYCYHVWNILSFVWYVVLGNIWAWDRNSDCRDDRELLIITRVIVSLNNAFLLITLCSLTLICYGKSQQR
mmetsp:Transcript_19369/g.21971  ORF Transcript_19369/g.21971 Transcript_19369/m.21971 type:complete len:299 (+) Transcript_19369:112-1008(+)